MLKLAWYTQCTFRLPTRTGFLSEGIYLSTRADERKKSISEKERIVFVFSREVKDLLLDWTNNIVSRKARRTINNLQREASKLILKHFKFHLEKTTKDAPNKKQMQLANVSKVEC